jgi:ParB family transcriptional regulator, chromosome partitioning protein
MWDFLLIDLKDIVSSVDREKFSDSELETLADLIVEMGGLMRPILLKKIGFESFKVIDGHLEYYASLIAQEKDPNLETINAFVVEPEGEAIALQQTRSRSIESRDEKITDLEGFVKGLERRLEKKLQTFHEEYRKDIVNLNKKIENLLPPPPPPPLSIISILNTCEINELLRAKLPKNCIDSFIEVREAKKFDSLDDIIKRVKGIGEKRLIILLDYLSKT